MTNLILRYIITSIVLIITAAIVHALQYDSSHNIEEGLQAIQAIPKEFGEWHGKDFPLEDKVYDILETRSIIHRNYVNKNDDTVYLSIVYYNDTKVDFHAPEACIGGLGLKTIKTEKTLKLNNFSIDNNLKIAQMITTIPDNKMLSYYFYMTDGFAGSNYIKMRLSIAKNKFTKNDTSGSLVRISTTINEDDLIESQSILLDFLKNIFPILRKYL